MQAELDKYGIQMPSFGKIGGILANELSVDEAAVHAAILAINEEIDKGVAKELLKKLNLPAAGLLEVQPANCEQYLSDLKEKKQKKIAQTADKPQVSGDGEREREECRDREKGKDFGASFSKAGCSLCLCCSALFRRSSMRMTSY